MPVYVKLRGVSLLVAVVTGLAGCVTLGPIQRPEAPDRAMIYGSIILEGAAVDSMVIYGPEKVLPSKHHVRVYPNGTFFLENLKPGPYGIAGFGANGRTYSLLGGDARWKKQFLLTVKPGALTYVGSFAAGDEDYELFRGPTYKAVRRARPTSGEILRDILRYTAGTGWDERIRRSL